MVPAWESTIDDLAQKSLVLESIEDRLEITMTTNESPAVFAFPEDCPPGAGRLILALRESAGYNPYVVMSDIIDNSIDADAKTIRVFIRKCDGKSQVVISDDGYGMSKETLHEALRLGSNIEKDKVCDLGCFGIGLKVGAIAIGKRLTVLTKEKEGVWNKKILDISQVVALDRWVVFSPSLEEKDQVLIDECECSGRDGSGTIVILEELDRFPISVTTQTANILRKKISRIFWKKIVEGLVIEINGEKVDPYDPLEWNDFVIKKIAPTRIQPEEGEVEVPFEQDGVKKKAKLKYRCMAFPYTDVPDPNRSTREEIHPINHRNDGIYVYRNGREISMGQDLQMFAKHSTHTTMRIGLYFNAAELDFAFGTNFNKSNLDPERIQQSIRQKLGEEIIGPFAAKVTKAARRNEQEKTADGIQKTHNEAAEKIREKSRALALPIVPEAKEKRTVSEDSTEGTRIPNGTGTHRGLGSRKQSGKLGIVEYQAARMGRDGQLYSADREDRKIIVTWNADHPLYFRISQNDEMMRIFDWLVHSMACAELHYMYSPDAKSDGFVDPIDIITKFKSDMSNNLRILLSE